MRTAANRQVTERGLMHLQYKNTNKSIQTVSKTARHAGPHLHNTLELIYMLDGTLELGVGQELYHMETGDIGIVFPDIIHHYQVFGNDPHKIYCVNLAADRLGVFSEELQNFAPVCPVIPGKNLGEEISYALFRMMITGENEFLILQAYLQIVLARCLPLLDLDEKSKVGSSDLIYQTVAYISRHFRENITLDKMAKELCVSKYAVSRVFSGTFHSNFNQYLNDARIRYACAQLENTQDSIIEICLDSGFESQRTFNRAFKERYRMSPSQYRKKSAISQLSI